MAVGGMTLRTGMFRSGDGEMNNFTPEVLRKIFSKISHPIPIYLTHDGAGNIYDNVKRPVLGYAYKFGLQLAGNQILFQAFLMDPASKQLVAFSGYDCTSAEVDVTKAGADVVDGVLTGIAAVPVPAISGTNLQMQMVKLSAPASAGKAKPTESAGQGTAATANDEAVEKAVETKPIGGERVSAITSFGDHMVFAPTLGGLQEVLMRKGFSADETLAFMSSAKVLFNGEAYTGPSGQPRSTATDRVSQSYSGESELGPTVTESGGNGGDPIAHELAGPSVPQGKVEPLPRTQMDEQNTQHKGFAAERKAFQAKITKLEADLKTVTTNYEALLGKEVAAEINSVKQLGFANPEGMIDGLAPSQQLVVLAKIKENFAAKTPAVGVNAGTNPAGANFNVEATRAEILQEFGSMADILRPKPEKQ